MSASRSRYAWWAPYAFIAPFVILFSVFTIYPLIYSVVMAMQQTFGAKASEFVGFDNFITLWNDTYFWKALKNTFIFAAGSILIQLPCALGLALLLNRPEIKARAFFRMIFFAPVLVGLAFVAILFGLIFEKNTGLINVLFLNVASTLDEWLPFTVKWDKEFPFLAEFIMPSLIIASFWMYVGYNMVYFLAALQNVSQDLVEAATVDGANAWHRFWNVTLPAIRPVATFVFLISFIGSMQLFELPYLLLGIAGGKDGGGLTVVMYLFDWGFERQDLGYASAVGWALAVILLCFALLQKFLGRAEER